MMPAVDSEYVGTEMSQKRLNSLEKEVSQVHNETQKLHSEIQPGLPDPYARTSTVTFTVCFFCGACER